MRQFSSPLALPEPTGNSHLAMAGLTRLLALTAGSPQIMVGLVDGPVLLSHADLRDADATVLPGSRPAGSAAGYRHGTFIAGILFARRGCAAPALCPGCRFALRSIFPGAGRGGTWQLSASADELAAAIVECVDAGCSLINVSAAFASLSAREHPRLRDALSYAAQHDAPVIVAAGNQGAVGGSELSRHPWVIPVVACGGDGRPLPQSNLGHGIGRRGLAAPGSGVTSLAPDGPATAASGSSIAAAFVTGTLALLLSLVPGLAPARARAALRRPGRLSVVPPLLDAWGAYHEICTAPGTARSPGNP